MAKSQSLKTINQLRSEIEELRSRLKQTENEERKRVEEELRKSEIIASSRLREIEGIYQNAPIGLGVFDLDLRFLRINERLAEINGIPAAEHIGKTVEQLIPGLVEPARSIRDAILKTGKPQTGIEVTGYTPAQPGILRSWDEDWLPLRNDAGNIVGISIVVEETTERKRIEQALRESEQSLTEAQHLAHIGSWEWNIQSGNIHWSKELFSIFGLDCNSFVPSMQAFAEFVHPEDREFVNIKTSLILSEGKPYNFDFRIVRTDGSIRYLNTVGAIKDFDEDGKPRLMKGANQDITERKQIEKDLIDTYQKLNMALENGNAGTWEWNFGTNEVIWDERTEKIFGLEPGTFGKTLNDFENNVHEEDIPHVRNALTRAIQTDNSLITVFRTRSQNGEMKYINSRALVIKNQDGKPISMSGVIFDVTGMQKEAEESIFKINEELLRSNRDLQQFAYVASHDLQEPLRMVSSFTQLLELRYTDKLDEDGKEFIKFAVDGSKRMYDLLNALLSYSRVQTKGKEFVKVKMNDVIEIVIQNLILKVKETNAVINFKKLPIVFADENQMIQLIQNLVENSIKFSSDKPNISISSKSENKHYIFSVKDEGIGIEPQYFDRIFQIFQRLNPKEEFEGTGIGLAICKRIVERHSGKIWIESEPGKGSTVYFTIPKNQVS